MIDWWLTFLFSLYFCAALHNCIEHRNARTENPPSNPLARAVNNMRILLPSAVAALFVCAGDCLSTDQKLFGHSVKNGPLPAATEVTTFEHNCTKAPCTITQIHVPSIYPPKGEEWKWTTGIISFYIDDDADANPDTATPTISMTLLELAGEGSFTTATSPQDGSPYALSLMGKTAVSGGVFSTMRVPFQRRIRTTIQADPTVKGQSVYWMIVRGIEAYPVVLGDLTLPDSAQLAVYRTGPTPIENLEMRTLANVTAGKAGALMRVNFDASGPTYGYLEACMRFYPDGAPEPVFLSSGAEDYFLSASYFDEGMFKGPNSGLTYFDHKGSVNVYKTHDRDPVLWNDGMELVFRCNEDTTGCGDTEHCPNQFCEPSASGQQSVYSYEFDEAVHAANLERRQKELDRQLQVRVFLTRHFKVLAGCQFCAATVSLVTTKLTIVTCRRKIQCTTTTTWPAKAKLVPTSAPTH